jgi:hypothetical protein
MTLGIWPTRRLRAPPRRHAPGGRGLRSVRRRLLARAAEGCSQPADRACLYGAGPGAPRMESKPSSAPSCGFARALRPERPPTCGRWRRRIRDEPAPRAPTGVHREGQGCRRLARFDRRGADGRGIPGYDDGSESATVQVDIRCGFVLPRALMKSMSAPSLASNSRAEMRPRNSSCRSHTR